MSKDAKFKWFRAWYVVKYQNVSKIIVHDFYHTTREDVKKEILSNYGKDVSKIQIKLLSNCDTKEDFLLESHYTSVYN